MKKDITGLFCFIDDFEKMCQAPDNRSHLAS